MGLTAYIDIDLTIVDYMGNLLPHAAQRIREMKEVHHFELVAWSHGGADHAQRVLAECGLAQYFTAILSKPDFVIDDSPDGVFDRARVITANKNVWSTFWEQVFKKEVY